MSPKGTFTYKFRGIRRKQDKTSITDGKKYKCPSCSTNWDTRGAMCRHYKEKHQAVLCTDCGKQFSSPLTLARHTYKHKERPFKCDKCAKNFAFQSELDQHSYVHKGLGSFFCMAKNCGREFIWQGDLNAHVVEHTRPWLKCDLDAKCTYSTRNPRLYKAHTNTHTRTKTYPCRYCGEEFDYTQQRKRHIERYHQ